MKKDKCCIILLYVEYRKQASKINEKNQTKQKQTHRYREQGAGYQGRRGRGVGKMSKGDQLYW